MGIFGFFVPGVVAGLGSAPGCAVQTGAACAARAKNKMLTSAMLVIRILFMMPPRLGAYYMEGVLETIKDLKENPSSPLPPRNPMSVWGGEVWSPVDEKLIFKAWVRNRPENGQEQQENRKKTDNNAS